MAKSKLTVEKLKSRIREMDPGLPESDESFKAALVILAATKLGHLDRERLAEFTGIPMDLIEEFGERLIANEAWMPDGSLDRAWQRSADGIDFWMLVAVATGDFTRQRKGGEFEYRTTDLCDARVKELALENAH